MIHSNSLRVALTVLCMGLPFTLSADISTVSTSVGLSFTSSIGSVVLTNPNGTVFAMTGVGGGSASQTGSGPISAGVISEDLPDIFPGSAGASADAGILSASNSVYAETGLFPFPIASTGRSTITGTLEIQGAGAPATLNASIALTLDQHVQANFGNQIATGESIVLLTLSDGDNPIAFDRVVSLGFNNESIFDSSQFLTGSSSLLQPDTPYTFTLVAESDAGVALAPEPSFLFLSAGVLSALVAARRLRRPSPKDV
jgi:hypothetical protein